MKFLCAAILALMALTGQVQAQQYATITAAEIERLLKGSDQERSAATFYLGGALDALSMTNGLLVEQQSPLYCPGSNVDLRPSTMAPKFLQHIADLRQKPRAADALKTLTASTILLVMLTIEYPCDLGDGGSKVVPPSP